jgi:hypothetical protein
LFALSAAWPARPAIRRRRSLSVVIAGLDPAIHDELLLDQP